MDEIVSVQLLERTAMLHDLELQDETAALVLERMESDFKQVIEHLLRRDEGKWLHPGTHERIRNIMGEVLRDATYKKALSKWFTRPLGSDGADGDKLLAFLVAVLLDREFARSSSRPAPP